MILEDQADVTRAVELAMQATPDPRLRAVMAAVVRHLHALVREVRPTEAEFEAAIGFLVGIGQATGETKNEVVLAADVLGISTLVGLLNNPVGPDHTAAALLGPFWRLNAPACELGASIARADTPGEPLAVSGQVRDRSGAPIADAAVDVWQASPVGLYENQDPEQPEMNLRGLFRTDADGRYHFRSVRPAGYPVPTDGPVGDLLRAQRRHPYRPAHLHFMVSAPGFKTLTTQVFADDSENLDNDVTISVIASLLGRFERDGAGGCTLEYDLVLEPGESRIPAAPIP